MTAPHAQLSPADVQRSSMENFLDEYQLVRLIITVGGTVMSVVYGLLVEWTEATGPIIGALAISGGHAVWCRVRSVRLPRIMLALDLTLFGWLMTLVNQTPEIATAGLAFLTLITVIFTSGIWMLGFLAYIMSWYGYGYFQVFDVTAENLGTFGSVVFTIAGLGLVISRVRGWLGRLDGNRSQMLGTVSHELRNNLTGMMGLTQVVATGDDLSHEEITEFAGLAHQQAVDATEIVEDLLTISRLERSALSVDVEKVDVNQEVDVTARRFTGEGDSVIISAASDLPPASADALRVRQILRNLLSNAVRYGGSEIHVISRLVGTRVEVVVSDDGDGVPVEDESTIFLPYRRSTHTRRDASSIGLGLWICKQLAGAMGGTLDYRRIEDTTQFVLSLSVYGAGGAPNERSVGRLADRVAALKPDQGPARSVVAT